MVCTFAAGFPQLKATVFFDGDEAAAAGESGFAPAEALTGSIDTNRSESEILTASSGKGSAGERRSSGCV
jgi:hypothetical protein